MVTVQGNPRNAHTSSPTGLFHLLARIESEIEIFFLLYRPTNITLNMIKVVIKILQASAVTETV